MKKPIVSFDFDGTLSRPDVQEYAQLLLAQGVEVRVTTTRYDEMHAHKYGDDYPHSQDDLWEVVDRLGIPRHHVRYTNMEWKYRYLIGTAFIFHLDDNTHEFAHARYNSCKIPMIQVNSGTWQRKCNGLLQKYKAKYLEKTDVSTTTT